MGVLEALGDEGSRPVAEKPFIYLHDVLGRNPTWSLPVVRSPWFVVSLFQMVETIRKIWSSRVVHGLASVFLPLIASLRFEARPRSGRGQAVHRYRVLASAVENSLAGPLYESDRFPLRLPTLIRSRQYRA